MSGPVTSSGGCSAQTNEERGFTGHEMLDELGFIHMNGRMHDPITGRFLQADPIILSAYDGQNYNRYSYVMNNPLSYTDPTGFSWWTKWRKTVFSVVAAIAVPWAVGNFLMNSVAFSEVGMFAIGGATEGGAAVLTTAGNAVAAISGGFAAGGISGGNIQSAVQGAFTAALTFGVGELSGAHGPTGAAGMSAGQRAGQIAGHAAIGCASHAAAGTSCKAGAMSAGFSALAGHVPGVSDTGLLGRMAVGAIASKVGGGKAENGAMSAAFEYLYNDLCSPGNGCSMRKAAERYWNGFWGNVNTSAEPIMNAAGSVAGQIKDGVQVEANVSAMVVAGVGVSSAQSLPTLSARYSTGETKACTVNTTCIIVGPIIGGGTGLAGAAQTGTLSKGDVSYQFGFVGLAALGTGWQVGGSISNNGAIGVSATPPGAFLGGGFGTGIAACRQSTSLGC